MILYRSRTSLCQTKITPHILIVIGVLAAVGQHLFYNYLDGRDVRNVPISQAWVIRVGVAFSFLSKSFLIAAIYVSFPYGFWLAMRRKVMRIHGIDAAFSILHNPFKFFGSELLVKIPSLFIFAILTWCLPIAIIICPGSLTGAHVLSSLLIISYSNQRNSNGIIPDSCLACS